MNMVSKRNKRVFSLLITCILYVIFVCISRHYYGKDHTISSRYYSSIIIFAIPLVSFVLLLIKKKSGILSCFILFMLVFLMLVFGFAPFHDNYVNDFREHLKKLNSVSDFIVVPEKEQIRTFVAPYQYREVIPTNNKDEVLSLFLQDYRYWGDDIIVFLKEKKNDSNSFPIPHGTSLRLISRYITNKKKDLVSIYLYSPSKLLAVNDISVLSENNLFRNSDLEQQQNESDVRKKIQIWVDDGATFYKDPFLLPCYIELPTQYHIKELPFYPIAFSETSSPIEGKYSLHLKFNYEKYNYHDFHVKLLHQIKSIPGTLSFYVKALKPDSHLIISKIENDSLGRWNTTQPRYHVLLKDSQLYHLSFAFDSFISKNSLYLLQGVSSDILIDVIQYIPQNN